MIDPTAVRARGGCTTGIPADTSLAVGCHPCGFHVYSKVQRCMTAGRASQVTAVLTELWGPAYKVRKAPSWLRSWAFC
jgi:hypothetical protein